MSSFDSRRRTLALTLASTLAVLSLALGCDDESEEAEAESPEPVVGVMELPISFRFDSEPQNALRVEASPSMYATRSTSSVSMRRTMKHATENSRRRVRTPAAA